MNRATDWYDEARIAQTARVSVKTVRRQWERMWELLDLPPVARGYLDGERAARLIRHLKARRGQYKRRT